MQSRWTLAPAALVSPSGVAGRPAMPSNRMPLHSASHAIRFPELSAAAFLRAVLLPGLAR